MAISEARLSSDATPALEDEYDVFLNFRGEDTRHNFTDFLYNGLVDAGVDVFRDEEKLPIGEEIGENLLRAINNSKLYIPIFSQNYASSKWCLRELALMVDNVSSSRGQKSILPIFFDVEPEDVKLKTSLYKATFLEHEKKFPNKVEAWKEALAKVDEIKGWNVKKDQSQAAIVKLVVKEVLEKLKIKQKLVTEHLVGLDERLKDLIELLDVNHDVVQLVGIYGMGGIGKTTIAKVIFNQLSSHFGKYCSFLEDVRERSIKEGILKLQKKLLYDIGVSECVEKISDGEEGMKSIEKVLCSKKVLVVLDDVSEKDHIKKLIGNFKLGLGSRIIITTRDTTVLKVDGYKVETRQYEMLKMDDDLGLQLFGRHAFSGDFPSYDYHRLSRDIVSSTGGLPLAIEVIGSLLNGKDQEIWEETLEKLKKVPEKKILEKLRISYDDLDKHHKQIFLDIACFFFNQNTTNATYMWTNCQFYPKGGIKVLTDRCLVKILNNDRFWMHDQLIALGRQIVCEESQDDLTKQSRLWIAEEALQIIRTEERKHEVQGLRISQSYEITNEDFERLPNLRLLELCNGTFVGDFARSHSNLRWFSWSFPLEKNFKADNMHFDYLVICKFECIHFKDDSKAWDLIKRAQNLKVLSFTRCHEMTTIPDISKCSSLERLNVAACYGLKRIKSFIGNLRSLIELKIENCWGFRYLPEEIGALVKLKHFSLSRCCRLRELPSSIGNLTSLTNLDLSDTIIRDLPNSIGKLISLRTLRFPREPSINQENHDWQLPSSINTLVNLEEMDLSRRDVRGEIPDGIGELSFLRTLHLEHTRICRIPRTINMLHHLQTLNLRACHEIQELPELPTSLTCLYLESKLFFSIPNLLNLTNLVELLLTNNKFFGEKSKPLTRRCFRWIGKLSRPQESELNLVKVPTPLDLSSLFLLKELSLPCLDLETPVQLPSSLRRLDFQFCSLRKAQSLAWCLRLRNLLTLEFYHGEVEDIPLDGLPQLENLIICCCKWLQRLSIPLELRKLQQVSVSSCSELVEIQIVDLSKSLKSFCVCECKFLTKISGLSYLKNLENFTILRCNVVTIVEGLHELESLKLLAIKECTSLRRYGISLESYKEEILLYPLDKTKTEGGKESCNRKKFLKAVFKLNLLHGTDLRMAMRIVSRIDGIESTGLHRKHQQLTVVGKMDPVEIAGELRKRFCTYILSVGLAKMA